MEEKGQYDESYSVNECKVFDKSKEDLEIILNGFPNKETLANQIWGLRYIRGLYFVFLSFFISNIYTF